MRSPAKIILAISSGIIAAGGVVLAVGVLSTPRNFSSPSATIKVVDENGAPISGVEVGRNWYDSDCGNEGSDQTMTDRAGVVQFSEVPAKIGFFTGTLTKMAGIFRPCGAGSGTATKIYVRYSGRYEVVPKDKPLHPTGRTFQDSDGVTFYMGMDSRSNTMANLAYSANIKAVDYVLRSKRLAK